MKMNFDCMRDVLLWLELNLPTEFIAVGGKTGTNDSNKCTIGNLKEAMSQYSSEEVCYACEKLVELEFIKSTDMLAYGTFVAITAAGHQFLANIHNAERWGQIKEAIGSEELLSIGNIEQVSTALLFGSL